MIKRILLSIAAICATIGLANAKEYVALNLVTASPDLQYEDGNVVPPTYSCRISVDNKNIAHFEQRGYYAFPNNRPLSVKVDFTDDNLNIIWEYDEHIPDVLSARTFEASFNMYIHPHNGDKRDEYNYNVSFKNFKTPKPLNLIPGAEYYLKANEDGSVTVKEEWPIHELFTSRTDIEWVLYNEALGADDMFRIRLCKAENTDGPGFSENEAMWPVLLCRGKDFDIDKATTIAYIGGRFSQYKVFPADTRIPAEFWGVGLPEDSYNPKAIMKNARVMYDFWFCHGYPVEPRSISNFFYDIVNNKFCELSFHGTHYKPTETGDYRHTELDNGGKKIEWIEGIGAVGKDYASNLPYPVYNLPEGVTPTRLLYVRDTTTNEIIYGDPTLDKLYQGSADVSSQTVSDSPVVSTKWYDFTGRILPKQPADSPYIRVDLHSDGTTTTSRHLPTK